MDPTLNSARLGSSSTRCSTFWEGPKIKPQLKRGLLRWVQKKRELRVYDFFCQKSGLTFYNSTHHYNTTYILCTLLCFGSSLALVWHPLRLIHDPIFQSENLPFSLCVILIWRVWSGKWPCLQLASSSDDMTCLIVLYYYLSLKQLLPAVWGYIIYRT